MELRRLWLLVWNRKLLVVFLVIAALAAGYATTPRTARYQATSTLFVGVSIAFSSDLQLGQQYAAATFAQMATQFDVAQAAVADSGVPRSAGRASAESRASVVPGTTLIHLTVTDLDPVVAQELANGMAREFVNKMRKVYPVSVSATGQVETGVSPVSLTQEAGLPVVPLSNGLSRTLTLSGIFGLLAAIGLVLLLDYLDLSVRTPDDLERRIGLPVLGIIPLLPQFAGREPVLADTRPRETETEIVSG